MERKNRWALLKRAIASIRPAPRQFVNLNGPSHHPTPVSKQFVDRMTHEQAVIRELLIEMKIKKSHDEMIVRREMDELMMRLRRPRPKP